MSRIRVSRQITILIIVFSAALMAEVPQDVRTSVDRITGGHGTYVPDDQAYKVVLPRYEATIVNDWQRLSPNLGLNSWLALKAATHDQAILTGQLLLLEDEVDLVISTALEAGLNVTGLAASPIFGGPHLYTMDVNATGTFQNLAAAFRKCLDEAQQVRKDRGNVGATEPDAPLDSSIDSAPLDAVLPVKGAMIDGTYRAAMGMNTLLGSTQLGPEMGMSTWVSIAGTNQRAVAHGEFVATADDLQKVLRALRMKGMAITSIRNHTIGERPQCVFVHFRGEGPAVELARAVRYALDAQAAE
jgi:hypothetical protein